MNVNDVLSKIRFLDETICDLKKIEDKYPDDGWLYSVLENAVDSIYEYKDELLTKKIAN